MDSTTGGFVGASRGDRINIPRTEILAGISAYTVDQQDLLLWLHGYCLDQLHGSRSALVEWLQVDWTTVTRIWRGAYGADISQFEKSRADVEQAEHYARTTAAAHAAMGSLEKPLIAMIRGYCIGGGLAIALKADIRIGRASCRERVFITV